MPDEPGVEMQHDTTVYKVKLAGQPTRVIASLLYLRYSKRRYLKFYRVFNRFAMKCFLHEALMFWGYAAKQCIIDNTNLARLRGSGKQAVIVPEMAAFAERYGFQFLCHAIGHANRKAGEERSFWTVETNFLPGRSFQSLEDLNRQALQWATVRMEHRPASKTRLIPAKAFEHERHYLTELPAQLPAPYWPHERGTDEYGYVAVRGELLLGAGDQAGRRQGAALRGPLEDLSRADSAWPSTRCRPTGSRTPVSAPRGSRRRGICPSIATTAPSTRNSGCGPWTRRWRPTWTSPSRRPASSGIASCASCSRSSRKVTPTVFAEALTRAQRYRVVQMETLQRIAWLCMSQGQATPARRGGGRELPPASGLPGGLSDRRAGPVRL